MAALAKSKTKLPLNGLSIGETEEFEQLDAVAAPDVNGKPTWEFEGQPLTPGEERWLVLYERQVRATTGLLLSRTRVHQQ
jgi:hypothetical protein